MNKEFDKANLDTHNIMISQRQTINISGITKINSFDTDEFLLETTMGSLGIKGRELEIIKLDTYEGTIIIKGIIDGFSYLDENKRKKEDSMITRLFKWWF